MIDYARHFAWLGAWATALAIARPGRLLPGIGSEFAVYGALHAGALSLSFRTLSFRRSPARRLQRMILLVAGGSILSLLTARLGLQGLKIISPHHPAAGPAMVVAVAAGLGAFAYGALLRSAVLDGAVLDGGALDGGACEQPSARALVAISFACAAAASLSFEACRRLHAAGALWVVFPWWLAFSGGLWCASPVPRRPFAGAMPISRQSR